MCRLYLLGGALQALGIFFCQGVRSSSSTTSVASTRAVSTTARAAFPCSTAWPAAPRSSTSLSTILSWGEVAAPCQRHPAAAISGAAVLAFRGRTASLAASEHAGVTCWSEQPRFLCCQCTCPCSASPAAAPIIGSKRQLDRSRMRARMPAIAAVVHARDDGGASSWTSNIFASCCSSLVHSSFGSSATYNQAPQSTLCQRLPNDRACCPTVRVDCATWG